MAKTNWTAITGIGTLVVLALIAIGFFNPGLFAGLRTDADGNVIGPGTTIIDSDVTSITMTYNDKDEYKGSLDPATKVHFLDEQVNVSDDATKVLELETEYEAIAGFGSTTYYAEEILIDSADASGDRMTVRTELCKAGVPTVTFKNKDGSVNSATNPQAIGADDEVEIKMNVDVGSNLCFGSPDAVDENVVVGAYDGTYFDGIEVEGQARAVQPKDYSALYAELDEEDEYKLDTLLGGAEKEYTVIVESDTSNDPTAHNVTMNLYDANVDFDADGEVVIRGVEDEADNVLSLARVNATMYFD